MTFIYIYYSSSDMAIKEVTPHLLTKRCRSHNIQKMERDEGERERERKRTDGMLYVMEALADVYFWERRKCDWPA